MRATPGIQDLARERKFARPAIFVSTFGRAETPVIWWLVNGESCFVIRELRTG
jgi:hypothetical protein